MEVMKLGLLFDWIVKPASLMDGMNRSEKGACIRYIGRPMGRMA